MARVIILSVGVSALVTLATCSSEPPSSDPCGGCPEGFLCGEDQLCHLLCNIDADCPARQRCREGLCAAGFSGPDGGGGDARAGDPVASGDTVMPVGDPGPAGDSPAPGDRAVEGDPITVGDARSPGDTTPVRIECSGFAAGQHTETRLVDGGLELVPGAQTGSFVGRCSASDPVDWNAIAIVARAPYGKPLPAVSETGYEVGNVSVTGLDALYRFEGTGNVATGEMLADASANSREGRAVNADAMGMRYALGRFGAAIELDGVDDWIDLGPNNPVLRNPSAATICVWLKATALGPMGLLSYSINSPAPSAVSRMALALETGGAVQVTARSVDTDARRNERSAAGAIPEDAAWHHVAGVADYLNDDLHLYVDGELLATTADGSLTGPPPDTDSTSAAIGAEDDGSSSFFAGRLDEVALFTRALSSDQVRQLYLRGALRFGLQVRVCSTTCTNEPFVGPDGTAGSDYSEINRTGPGVPVFNVEWLPSGRIFEYRIELATADTNLTPHINDVIVRGY